MSGHEFDLIHWISRQPVRHRLDVTVGIGDDAAVVTQPDGSQLLFATDLLMEGTHFLPTAAPEQIGHKALAVNLSDIAAMAGIPETALVSVALPRSAGRYKFPPSAEEFARRLMAGVLKTADDFGVNVIGGDTNIWDGPLVINVAVNGRATARGPVLRTGARPGDVLFVTGPLGGSLNGRHLTFTPRVREALRIHELVEIRAMLDLSDGLSSDVRHMLTGSGLGVVIREPDVPIHEDAASPTDDRTPFEHALTDGEDFELLFAVAPVDAKTLMEQTDISVYSIGEFTDRAGECLVQTAGGPTIPLPDGGWKHRFG
jgi:thiamine-monophosphate kinase